MLQRTASKFNDFLQQFTDGIFFIFAYRQPFCTSGVCVSALMSIAVDAVAASFCCQRLT